LIDFSKWVLRKLQLKLPRVLSGWGEVVGTIKHMQTGEMCLAKRGHDAIALQSVEGCK
jgi:hypothetical protein